jgi:hypothetical protein
MSDQRTPHPKNAPGPFYVVDGCCITCMAPHAEAPTLMGFDDTEGHCFVKQQPQSDEEIYMAIRAVRSSEVQCLRYRGHDPVILRRLAEIGEANACDSPPATSAPILRNRVTFATSFAHDAWDVTIALRDYILSQKSEHVTFRVTSPTRKGKKVVFAYSWYEDYYELTVGPANVSNDRWLVHHSPIWETGSVAVSLMIDDWLHSDPCFSDVRWYASEEMYDEWQERPY